MSLILKGFSILSTRISCKRQHRLPSIFQKSDLNSIVRSISDPVVQAADPPALAVKSKLGSVLRATPLLCRPFLCKIIEINPEIFDQCSFLLALLNPHLIFNRGSSSRRTRNTHVPAVISLNHFRRHGHLTAYCAGFRTRQRGIGGHRTIGFFRRIDVVEWLPKKVL
jgi:hypothetical protein